MVRVATGRGRSLVAGEALLEEEHHYASPVQARWEYDRRVAEHESRGYLLLFDDSQEAPVARDGELEQALRRWPDDDDTRLVYADWLAERGDPRGELASTQHGLALATDPATRDRLRRRELELLTEHRARLFGELGRRVVSVSTQHYAIDQLELDWRLGFVDGATLYAAYDQPPAAELLRLLLELPICQLIDRLSVARLPEERRYQPVLDALAEVPLPQTLRQLELGERRVGELRLGARHARLLERLERLTLRAEALTVEPPVELGRLQHLSLQLTRLDTDLLARLASADLPALAALILDGADERPPLDALAHFFEAPGLQRLSSLGLRGTHNTLGVIQTVAASRLAPRLEGLDVTRGDLGREQITGIVEAHRRLPRLSHLVTSRNRLGPTAISQLRRELGGGCKVTN